MNNSAFSYLNFIHFSQLNLWDFKRYISKVVSSKYPIVKLANFINEENKKIKPFDFPEEKFEILGVNNKTGLFDAYIEDGNKINQPYKIVENGFLAYNPYRINVGSIGLKTKEQKYKYISPAYVVFSCKKDLLPEFLYILFRTDKFNELIRENTTGSVRQTLSFSSMGQIQIPLPSLEKQKEIVDRYNEKIKLAEEQETQIKNCKSEAEQYLLDILGLKLNKSNIPNKTILFTNFRNLSRWDYEYNKFFSQKILDFGNKYNTVRFGTCVNFYQYGTSSKASSLKQGTPILRMNNIIDGKLDISDLKFINSLKENEIQNLKLEKGDLLFNRTNSKELVGKMCIFDKIGDYIFASYLIKIKIERTKANPYFINYLFNSPILRTQIDATSRQVTGQANINTEELSNFLIPLPPLSIQNEIVNEMAKIREEIEKLNNLAEQNRQLAQEEFEKELFE